MATDFAFRKKAMKELPSSTGVYVLCDLDEVPIYVGQSKDGIRSRRRPPIFSSTGLWSPGVNLTAFE